VESVHPKNRFIGRSFLNLFEQISQLNGQGKQVSRKKTTKSRLEDHGLILNSLTGGELAIFAF
jgi:hypothetical protein